MQLSEWISECGISQVEVASGLGVDQSTISRLLSRARVPSPALMKRIYDLTEGRVTPNDLIGLNDLPRKPDDAA